MQEDLNTSRRQIDDLNVQIAESGRANQSTLQQLHDLQQERDSVIQQLQEANKVRSLHLQSSQTFD